MWPHFRASAGINEKRHEAEPLEDPFGGSALRQLHPFEGGAAFHLLASLFRGSSPRRRAPFHPAGRDVKTIVAAHPAISGGFICGAGPRSRWTAVNHLGRGVGTTDARQGASPGGSVHARSRTRRSGPRARARRV